MKRLLLIVVLIGIVILLGKNVLSLITIFGGNNASLILQGMNPYSVRERILEHYNTRIRTDIFLDQHTPLEIRTAFINNDPLPDLIAIYTVEEACGTDGCITAILLQEEKGKYTPIPFEYAVHELEVLSSVTMGMHDLMLHNNSKTMLVWNGNSYTSDTF